MNEALTHELQFTARDLEQRCVDIRAMYAQCTDSEAMRADLIAKASRSVAQAVRDLSAAALAKPETDESRDLTRRLQLSIDVALEKKRRVPGRAAVVKFPEGA